MNSHHFIGAGRLGRKLDATPRDAELLLSAIGEILDQCGLRVVNSHHAAFEGGGHTLVWILAESHLVLHLWPEEQSATIDLHVCDFRADNEARARRTVDLLTAYCFAPGSAEWREMRLAYPAVQTA